MPHFCPRTFRQSSGSATRVAREHEEEEQVAEEVDHVEVQLDDGDDVVVDTEMHHDIVRVVDDEHAEDDGAKEGDELAWHE